MSLLKVRDRPAESWGERRPHGRAATWAATPAALLCAAGFALLHTPSPGTIKDGAVRALGSGDTVSLCRLADPAELSRINLTPDVVRSFLDETVWRHGYPRVARVDHAGPTPVDQSVWRVNLANDRPDAGRLYITAIDDLHRGWKLDLSKLLWDSCWWARGGRAGRGLYITLARKYHIRGLRDQDGSYRAMKQISP